MKKISLIFVFLFIYNNYFMNESNASIHLNKIVIVKSQKLLLGDIFEGLNPLKANKYVTEAPEPGKRKIIRLNLINKLINKYNINYEMNDSIKSVIVKRSSRLILPKEIYNTINLELKEITPKKDFLISIRKKDIKAYIPTNSYFDTKVINFDYDSNSERFTTSIDIYGENFRTFNINISGFAKKVIEIPVLKNGIKRGNKITEVDLKFIKLPESNLQLDIITDINDFYGKEAKRNLSKEKPIRNIDLRNERLVLKGQPVTLRIESKLMSLKTIGKALEHGSKGEFIKILNPRTSKVIMGIVVGFNDVKVPINNRIKFAKAKN